MIKFQDVFKALSISDLFLIVFVGREQNIQRHKNSSKLQPADRTSTVKIDTPIHIYTTTHFPGLVQELQVFMGLSFPS